MPTYKTNGHLGVLSKLSSLLIPIFEYFAAKKRVTEREYWANTRGNAAHGSRFTTDKDFLRNAIHKASSKCNSEKAFASMLKEASLETNRSHQRDKPII